MAEDDAQAAEAEAAPSAARIARDAAVAEAARTLAYLGVCVLASVLWMKREEISRAWRKLAARPPRADVPPEELADFRREVSRLEHGGPW